MESNRKFTLIVFNTCTQEYEEVIVTEEVYRAYCRTRWNIKDNDQSFFDHEIQTSGMIGSQDGAYENFREFIDAINTPEHIILEQIKKEALYQAISALPAADQALVQGLFFKGQSELDYQEALANLERVNWTVDCVLTHCAPSGVVQKINPSYGTDELTDFLEMVSQRCKFAYWFFGHYHENRIIDQKYILQWEKISELGF